MAELNKLIAEVRELLRAVGDVPPSSGSMTEKALMLQWSERGSTITLTRVAPRPMDGDNAIASMKACRDGVAEALGVNDNDPRIAWVYAQRRGGVREHMVEVTIE